MLINNFVINEELIGEDHEITIRAYLQRDIEFNLDPKNIIEHALKKLNYDGNIFSYLNVQVQVEMHDIINNNDIEGFYRSLPFDALNYLGY